MLSLSPSPVCTWGCLPPACDERWGENMKVLQVVKTNRGATWAYNQAKWLTDNGVEIITVLPDDEQGYAAKYKAAGMSVVKGDWSLPLARPWLFFRRAREIRAVVEQYKPDLIHLHFVTNVLMGRLALRHSKTPRLFQVPGPLHLESPFFNFAERAVATAADHWAGACHKTCRIYEEKGIAAQRVSLAYYGSPIAEQSAGNEETHSALHAEYGFGEEEKLVAMVSYFYKPKRYIGQTRGLKGHEDFIDAMELVLHKHPTARAVIIGNAWDGAEAYEQQVIAYAKQKLGDRITFTGYRSDVKDIYPELDIAVHPSHSENLGGAAESLAHGIPTIATDIGGFPDIVHHGETGLLVPAKDPAGLAEAICWMLEHPEEASAMGERGRQLVCELLDIAATAGQIKAIYQKILQQD